MKSMQIEPLSLVHQELLENRFQRLDISLSEYSFANLYLFRQLHNYQVITIDEMILIKGITRDSQSFMMLTSHPAEVPSSLLQFVLNDAEFLFPIPETWLPFFENFLLEASFKEEDSDYLFAISKLAHFPGRHLSKKRNLVKQLFKTYEVKTENLSHQLNDVQRVLDHWQQNQTADSVETDYQACQGAIQSFHKLHLHGRLTYVNRRPVGFTIGEWITHDCYVIHFCKADSLIKGLYQYLYQDLAQSIEGKGVWINLEQDLGIPAIRDAKHSYMPDQKLQKWRVRTSSISSMR